MTMEGAVARGQHRGNARPAATTSAAARSPLRDCRVAAPGMLIRNRVGSNAQNITSPSYISNGYHRTGTANPVRQQGRITAGKRSRRGGEGQGAPGAPVSAGGSALLSVPTPIRSTSAPSLPGEALVFEVTTKSPEARTGAVSPQPVVATAAPPVAQPTAQPQPTAPVQPAPQLKPQPPTLPQTTEVPTEQGIMNHLPWLSEKRTSLLQLLAEWSQSHRVLDDLTDRLRRLGRDRPADQGPCELETGLRQVIAMVSHGLGSVETERQNAVCRLAIGSFEELVAHLVLQQRLLCLQKPFEASKRLLDDHGWSRRFSTSTDSACFLHKRPVRSVNFSSGGQLLCTSSEDGTARVYELETGRMVDHGTTIWWSDFSCDDSMLCTASDDRSVRVYDCKTWKLLEMFGHGLPAKCASFSPDGQSVATASGDAFVRIFDLNEGDEVAKLKHDSWVISVRYSPDGTLLATGSADKCIRIFDVTSPEAKLVSKKKFSGLDRVCAVSGDHALVYDVESGEMIRRFEHGGSGTTSYQGRDLLQQFEFLELKTSTYENLRVAFHGAGEPAPVLPTPPSRPPEMFPPSPEKMVMLKDLEVGLSAMPVGRPAAPPVVPRLHLGAAKNGVDIDSAATNLSGTPSMHSSDESLCSPTAGPSPPLPKDWAAADIAHVAGLLARSQSCVTLHERKACVEASPLTKQRILHQAVVAEEEEAAASENSFEVLVGVLPGRGPSDDSLGIEAGPQFFQSRSGPTQRPSRAEHARGQKCFFAESGLSFQARRCAIPTGARNHAESS
eukprot:s5671_g4.t1